MPSLQTFAGAVSAGDWPMFVGMVLMGLVFLASRFGVLSMVPSEGKKWVVLGLSVAVAIGSGLMNHMGWMAIGESAMKMAVAAVGGYELIGRWALELISNKLKGAPPPSA